LVSSNNDLYDNTLAQIFPNPVRDVAHIQIDVDAIAQVTLDVIQNVRLSENTDISNYIIRLRLIYSVVDKHYS